MPEIPVCLNRRYRALDELIQELSRKSCNEPNEASVGDKNSNAAGIKLMCDFWNILKENPDCNLTQAVKQRMGLMSTESSSAFNKQSFACFFAGKCKDNCERCGSSVSAGSEKKPYEPVKKIKKVCCKEPILVNDTGSSRSCPKCEAVSLPLNKALCNLKEAASFDKRCSVRVSELLDTQKELQQQIQNLEYREKEGIELLKQADSLWSSMENAYKKKIAESLERQKQLLDNLKEVEANNAKWRRNKKELDSQMGTLNKCQQEIVEKIAQKNNDIKCLDLEIADFKKRIEKNNADISGASTIISNKKKASDSKIANINKDVSKISKQLKEANETKLAKEKEGQKYVKEARDDLQKICKVLLQKRLENEDLKAEKQSIEEEIELLKQTSDQCTEKCKHKQDNLIDEIKKVDQEIAKFEAKCLRCHRSTDTSDSRKLCSDCPRCQEEYHCLIKGDHCESDPSQDCVCMIVKEKFLDNVFDNMYTVLERQARSPSGKVIADTVLKSLKNSVTGKLNSETRRMIHDFVLNTVKKNLNLTIVGGAVKTRCEMEPEMYRQLMLCLKKVKIVKPPKEDKGTIAKKDSCQRWGGTNECNCPGGPKACVCVKRAPPPLSEPNPKPPVYEKEDVDEVVTCPHKKEPTPCGPDCAMYAAPNSTPEPDIAAWRPDPCSEAACPYANNPTAQCVIGPDTMKHVPLTHRTGVPIVPDSPDKVVIHTKRTKAAQSIYDPDSPSCVSTPPCLCVIPEDPDKSCSCSTSDKTSCDCNNDRSNCPRERIIQEVMGKYPGVTPVENVKLANKIDRETIVEDNRKHRNNKVNSMFCCGSYKFLNNKHNYIVQEALYGKNVMQPCTNNINETDSNRSREDELILNSVNPVILDPKFHPKEGTSDKNTSPPSSVSSNVSSCFETNDKCVGGSNVLQNADSIRICDTVKELLKDINVPDIANGNTLDSDVEWIGMESLIHLISSQPSRMELNSGSSHADGTKNGATQTANNPIASQNNDNPKQLKVEIRKCSDISTCTTFWEKPKNVYRARFLTEQATQLEYDQTISSNVTPHIKKKLHEAVDNSITTFWENDYIKTRKRKISFDENIRKDRTADKATQTSGPFTFLTYTSSGNLAMELDEEILELIERKSIESPKLLATFKKTDSGHHYVDFNSDYITDDTFEVMVKRSPLGTRFLEVSKGFINKLTLNDMSSSAKIIKVSDVISQIKEQPGHYKIPLKDKTDESIKLQEPNIFIELKRKLENNKRITVKIQKEGGVLKEIVVPIAKTHSGNIEVDINQICDEVKLPKGHAFNLMRSNSGEIVLNKCQIDDSSNAIIKKTGSGTFKLIVTPGSKSLNTSDESEYSMENLKDTCTTSRQSAEEFCKLVLKISEQDYAEPPCVLKSTSSDNYIIVPDKEYEIPYKETMQTLLPDKTEYLVNLRRISSDKCILCLDDEQNEPNALVEKMESGDIKIITKTDQPSTTTIEPIKTSTIMSPEVLNKLLHKCSQLNTDKKSNTSSVPTKQLTNKSVSDTNLYEHGRYLYSDQNDNILLDTPSAVLKRTDSGKYTVVLDKESKKILLQNLKRCTKNNFKGLVPIKRNESGEIIIAVNGNAKDKNHYGVLKITPSGNIYVVLDEEVVKDLTRKPLNINNPHESVTNATSRHLIGKLKCPVNKAVTTTCNAQPDKNSCDASKCVCSSVQIKYINPALARSEVVREMNIFGPDVHEVDWTQVKFDRDGSVKKCEPDKCTETCSTKTYGQRKALPHIIIKPPKPKRVLQNNPHTKQQCFYVVKSVYPVADDKLNSLKSPKSLQSDAEWDSLKFLPPQLPGFLKDYRY